MAQVHLLHALLNLQIADITGRTPLVIIPPYNNPDDSQYHNVRLLHKLTPPPKPLTDHSRHIYTSINNNHRPTSPIPIHRCLWISIHLWEGPETKAPLPDPNDGSDKLRWSSGDRLADSQGHWSKRRRPADAPLIVRDNDAARRLGGTQGRPRGVRQLIPPGFSGLSLGWLVAGCCCWLLGSGVIRATDCQG